MAINTYFSLSYDNHTMQTTMAAKRSLLVQLAFISSLLFLSSCVIAFDASKKYNLKFVPKEELNQPPQTKFIAVIGVTAADEKSFFEDSHFKPVAFTIVAGRTVYVGRVEGRLAIFVRSGVGGANAAATTQLVASVFNVYGIIHVGTAGGIDASLSVGDVVVPKRVAHLGIWDWVDPKDQIPNNDQGVLVFGEYNLPEPGSNRLGSVGFRHEEFYQASGTPTNVFWFETTNFLAPDYASKMIKLERCLNSRNLCVSDEPKYVTGTNAASANFKVSNDAFGMYIRDEFDAQSIDMESSAVIQTATSNGLPAFVVRGIGNMVIDKNTTSLKHKSFGAELAASNVAKAVRQLFRLSNVEQTMDLIKLPQGI